MIYQTLRTRCLSLDDTNIYNYDYRWYVERSGHGINFWMTQTKTTMFTNKMSYNEDTIELWKTQTYRSVIMYDVSNNMVRYGTVEETIVNNCEHRWYLEHYGHCVYLWMTRIETTMIIDDMSNVRGSLFISGWHKQKQRCSQMKCRTTRTLLNSGRHKHREGRS